uniref:Pre-mRNA cleavage complex 2 protein Pcf11 n=1 Tax=Eptatretus burgeri TaxID=7764 RepID=A0A8C4NF08_EPTBU
ISTMTSVEASGDVCEEYKSSLADLTFNSKPHINMLTILAEENLQYATDIVKIIEAQIAKATTAEKLPILYLMDSIIKNVGKDYLSLFTQNIVSTFVITFEKVDENTRKNMFKLRSTWDTIFPLKKLYALDMRVHTLDPAWPVKPLPANVPAASIHVNPKFLNPPVTNPQMIVSAFVQIYGVADQMRQELLAKKKQLLELQQKKLELELEQTKARLVSYLKSQRSVLFTFSSRLCEPQHEVPQFDAHPQQFDEPPFPRPLHSRLEITQIPQGKRFDSLQRHESEGPQGTEFGGPRFRGKRFSGHPRGSRFGGPRFGGPRGLGFSVLRGPAFSGPQGPGFDGPRGTGFDGPQGAPKFDGPRGTTEFDGPRRTAGFDVTRGAAGFDGPRGAPRFDGPGGAPRFDVQGGAPRFDDPGGAPRFDGPGGPPRFDGPGGAPRFDGPGGAARFDGPGGAPRFDGPGGNPRFDGPRGAPRFDGPGGAPRFDGPGGAPRFDGPGGAPRFDGPGGAPRFDGPGGAPRFDGPGGAPRFDGPGGAPRFDGPGGAPRFDGPGGAPRFDGPGGAPRFDGPGGAPRFDGPGGAPRFDGPGGAPRFDGPGGAPRFDGPGGAPRFDGPGGAPRFDGPGGARGSTAPEDPEVRRFDQQWGLRYDCPQFECHQGSTFDRPQGPCFRGSIVSLRQTLDVPTDVRSGHVEDGDFTSHQGPSFIEQHLERPIKRDEEPCRPPAVRSAPIDLQTNHIGQLDINALYTKLLAVGIIGTQAAKGEKHQPVHDVTSGTLFSCDACRRYDCVIMRLYTGIQCYSCGMRFTAAQTEVYADHLDWHYRMNRMDKDVARKVTHRKWYYSITDWIEFEEIADLEERARSQFFEQVQEEITQRAQEPISEKEFLSVTAGPAGVEELCDICQEAFQQYWDEDEEEWHLKNAVRVDNKVWLGSPYTLTCFDITSQSNFGSDNTIISSVFVIQYCIGI